MSYPVNACECTIDCLWYKSGLVQAALSGSGRYQKFARQFITSSNPSEQCGQYDQLTSQFPGTGPCYAVWAQTYPWFYRSVPFVVRFVQPCLESISVCLARSQTYCAVWHSVTQSACAYNYLQILFIQHSRRHIHVCHSVTDGPLVTAHSQLYSM